MAARTEVEKLREELNRVKAESSSNLFGENVKLLLGNRAFSCYFAAQEMVKEERKK